MIRDGATAGGRMPRAVVLALLAALLAGGGMLQPVFAWRLDVAPGAPAASAVQPWRSPIDQPRVSSFYGAPRANKPAGHTGIDFTARTGTPVRAVAAGVVVDSTDLFEAGERYGKVIVIAHANGMRSTYAHLHERTVQNGAQVAAGEQIGLSGATGKVTGPHLHLEVSDGARLIDPASLIAGLDEHAYPRALRMRPQGSQR